MNMECGDCDYDLFEDLWGSLGEIETCPKCGASWELEWEENWDDGFFYLTRINKEK